MKREKRKYFILDRKNGLHLTETGYFEITKGVLFKTKGFKEYANKHGIILETDYVSWSTFSFSFNVPYKSYFDDKYQIKVNTRLLIIKDDSESLVFDETPIYIYLNWKERFCLSYRFNRLLIQKKDFWMWIINVVIALGATVAGFMIVFS